MPYEPTRADTGRQAAYAGRSRDRRGMEPCPYTVLHRHVAWASLCVLAAEIAVNGAGILCSGPAPRTGYCAVKVNRRTPSTTAAAEDLARVLEGLRLSGTVSRTGDRVTMALPDGTLLRLATVPTRSTSPAAVRALVEARGEGDEVPVVVADRVSAQLGELLNDIDAGWLDRRGHLRLVRPGVVIDTDVPSMILPSVRGAPLPDDPCATPVGREVASELLVAPREARTRAWTREVAWTGPQLGLSRTTSVACPGPRRRSAPAVHPRAVLGSQRLVAPTAALPAELP